MKKEKETFNLKFKNHFRKHKGKYITGGICLIAGAGFGMFIKNRDSLKTISDINNKLETIKKETVWRIQNDDIRTIAEESFNHLTDEQVDKLIQLAHNRFNIEDWGEHIYYFIQTWEDDV